MEERKILELHESWCRVLKVHFHGLHVALFLKNGEKIRGKVKFTKPGSLRVDGVLISKENPITRCYTGMNKGKERRKPY